MERTPVTKYAKGDDGVYLAYQVVGDGDVVLVGAPPIISNVEVIWDDPEAGHFLRTVGSFCRFIHYDKRGQGMSDRVAELPTLEQRAADFRAVMDAEGVERAVVGGISEGGTTAALFAATYPERVTGLVVFGAFARLSETPGYPGIPAPVLERTAAAWEAGWGTPGTRSIDLIAPDRAGDARFLEWMNRYERQSSTPGGLRAQLRWLTELDVRPVLPVIRVPTLVMHRAGDRLIPARLGQWMADAIPDARYVELPGSAHVPYLDNALPLAELEEFVTGRRTVGSSDRVLATVLVTDIVSSTERASALGDREWRRVLDRHDALTRHVVERYGGRVVEPTGDGALATFDGPARGIKAACEVVAGTGAIDLAVRAGLHTGEIERRGDDVAGIAVHIGARVGALAGPGEVLASRTVKDLVAGSGIVFESRGEFDLKGIADRWELFRVVV